MKRYFINGWQYGREYFMSVGHFTTDEIERMENDGEVIVRNGHEFWINVEV